MSKYTTSGSDDDESLIPELKNAVGALFECRSEVSDEQLARFRHDVTHIQQEERTAALSRLGTPREPASYNYSFMDQIRQRFYRTRLDRIAILTLGIGAVAFAALTLVWPAVPRSAVFAAILASCGIGLVGQSMQSGRIGFLSILQREQLDDWAASLSATFIRGHHQVHDAEAALARRARERRNRRLMVIDLWTRPRQSNTSHEFDVVQEEILRYANEVDGGNLSAALACTKPNLDQMRNRLRSQVGEARQQVYYGNPLQFDVLITDDEAILSFPRRGTDRDLAFRFRSPAVVNELWDILQSQLGDRVYVESQAVFDENDIETVTRKIESQDVPMDFPVNWQPAT